MRTGILLLVAVAAVLAACVSAAQAAPPGDTPQFRRLPVAEYLDKMKGGWIGQMAGVGQGAPTEFKSKGAILPEEKMPKWKPELINQFNQDDIYVEMTFLRTLEEHGWDVSLRQAGIDFANSGYSLWHANKAGRDNLRRGIAPPDSGHPQFNKHADDIDYQIESDYAGLIAPGMPNTVVALGEKFGRLMNYGDGIYGGQFFGAMYAEAFFESDPAKIVRSGLAAIPEKSQYAEMVRDMLKWFAENPNDWTKTWDLVEAKYHADPAYTHGICSGPGRANASSIDAKLNGAYVVMGVLYGRRDPDATIKIACRAGQDSDCNPSSAAGVLFTTIGFAKLPDQYKSALNPEGKFSHTPYNFPMLVSVCEKLARQAVERAGGRIEKDASGKEVFVIPVQDPKPSKLERSWEPGPAANSVFTEEEKAKITAKDPPPKVGDGGQPVDMKAAADKFAPGWTIAKCGPAMDPRLYAEWGGRKNVLMTHPLSQTTGCVLSRTIDVPAGKKTVLRIVVANDPRGDFDLIVKVAGAEVARKAVAVNAADSSGKWLTEDVDLSKSAGKQADVEVINQPTGWSYEAAYWGEIKIVSE
jgi:hypothetical protein